MSAFLTESLSEGFLFLVTVFLIRLIKNSLLILFDVIPCIVMLGKRLYILGTRAKIFAAEAL